MPTGSVCAARRSRSASIASPDDCWLALRGVRTMAVRLDRQRQPASPVAPWLRDAAGSGRVLHPALPGAPRPRSLEARLLRRLQPVRRGVPAALQPGRRHGLRRCAQLFGIGASWGGYESLALPTTGFVTRTAGTGDFGGQMVRLHIGLEAVEDLIADLEQAMAALGAK